MEQDLGLFREIIIIFAVGFAGSLAARVMRLPPLLGYLAAGMLIGPHALGFIDHLESVETLAEFGVILLLFSVGIEVSFRDVVKLRNIAVFGGGAQILVTAALGYGVATLLGWGAAEAIVLGMVVSLSSTMVVLKTLNDRGDLLSLHGRILTGMLLVQDLAFVPMIAVLPALSGDAGSLALELAIGIGKAALVLVGMAALGAKALPWLLFHVTRLGSRELFIMAVVAITFTTAAITDMVGLSAALGAFVAGVALSESEYGHRALGEVTPLRDIFAAMFFVSLGMLTDPVYVVENPTAILVVAATVIVGKFAVTAVIARSFRYLPHTSLMAGLGMGQIGEFSFLLATTALGLHIVGEQFLTTVIVAAVLTMGLTPGMLGAGGYALHRLAARNRWLSPYRVGGVEPRQRPLQMTDHAIVCGLGRVGSMVTQSLGEHRIPFVGIDLDPTLLQRGRDHGFTVLHGDGSNENVLEAARVQDARILVISTGDGVSTWQTARQALAMKPDLDVVAVVRWREQGERLRELGVASVIWAEFEAGLETLRYSLYHYQRDRGEVDDLIEELRSRLQFGADDGLDDSVRTGES